MVRSPPGQQVLFFNIMCGWNKQHIGWCSGEYDDCDLIELAATVTAILTSNKMVLIGPE